MEFIEKAGIRIEHWIKHNEHHLQEYEPLAHELESADKNESARYMREMTALMAQGNDCLRSALKAL